MLNSIDITLEVENVCHLQLVDRPAILVVNTLKHVPDKLTIGFVHTSIMASNLKMDLQ